MKYKRTTIIFALTILLLIACSPYSNLDVESEVDEVTVSSFKDFGSINEDYHLFFEKEAYIKTLVDAINTSKLAGGDVDMPEGDYDILLKFNEGQSEGFHFWISEDSSTGTIMKIDDTATAYKLTKRSTKKLREILYH